MPPLLHRQATGSSRIPSLGFTSSSVLFCAAQRPSPEALGDEGFFDLLSRFQSNRMDDQRCSIQDPGSRLSPSSGPDAPPSRGSSSGSESAAGASAGRRTSEPAAAAVGGANLPGLRLHQQKGSQAVLSHLMANGDNAEPDDNFFDMLVKCQVKGEELVVMDSVPWVYVPVCSCFTCV